jgi:hypothetical protein
MKKISKLIPLSAILLSLTINTFAENDTIHRRLRGPTVRATSNPFGWQDASDYAEKPATTVNPTFDLSSFQLPEFRRRALTTSFRLSNSLNTERENWSSQYKDEENPWGDENSGQEKHFRNQFSLNTHVGFWDIHYTRKHQKETYVFSSIWLRTDYAKNKWNTADPAIKHGWTNFNPVIRFGQTNRRYLNENVFIGYGLQVRYNRQTYRYVRDTVGAGKYSYNRISQDFFVEIPLEIGYGRIEPVGDAHHAIQIFNALARRGVTSRTKTSDEILRFAEFIARQKNRRFLDARHRKIHELEAIDAFLQANGHRDTLNMAYFTTLEDIWVHGNRHRESGTRWALYRRPGYEFTSFKDKDHDNGEKTFDVYQNEKIFHNKLGVSFTYEKPIDLFWQNSFWTSLEYHQLNIKRKDERNLSWFYKEKSTIFWPAIRYSVNQRISYFPTTRTSAYAGYGLTYSYGNRSESRTWSWSSEYSERKAKEKSKRHDFGARIDAGASYFFSPQLQLSFYTSLRYDYLYRNSTNYYQAFYEDWDDYYYHSRHKSRLPIFRFYFDLSLNYSFF